MSYAYMWNLKYSTNVLQNRNKLTDIQKRLVVANWEGEWQELAVRSRWFIVDLDWRSPGKDNTESHAPNTAPHLSCVSKQS